MNGAEAIVLGAFGCGAFRNDPKVVAAAAKAVIGDDLHAFRAIEFAVYCRPGDSANYDAFTRNWGRKLRRQPPAHPTKRGRAFCLRGVSR